MKKLALLLTILMSFSIFAACGAEESPNTDGTVENKEDTLRNFDGAEFIVESSWINDFCPEQEGLTLDLDIAYDWWKQVEKDLNCVITPNLVDPHPLIAASVASGVKQCDLMFIEARDMYQLAKAGYLSNLDELESIDPLDDSRWSQNYGREMYTYNGISYAVKSKSYTGAAGGISGGTLVFNEALIKEFNVTHPYELLENGQWTFDTFKEMLPKVTDTSADHRIYGLVQHIDDLLPKSAVFANGGHAAVEIDGKLVFGFTQPEAVYALEWAKTIMTDKDSFKKVEHSNGDFAKGNATFYLAQAWVNMIMDEAFKNFSSIMNDIEFSWIHFPYGPNAEYGVTMAAWEQSTIQEWSIPITCDDEESSAYLLNYWLDPAKGNPEEFNKTAEAYNLRQRNQFFFSDESYEKFTFIDTNKILDYPLGLEDVRDQLNTTLVTASRGNKSVIEALSSIETKVNSILDEEYNNK
ncbi:MAG: transporter substrate-binding protein [Clostridia bacterium]|nr:transporter substrate-binding protein [Clostridia bacterium]